MKDPDVVRAENAEDQKLELLTTLRATVRDILGVTSRRPASADPKAGPFAVVLIRDIELLVESLRDRLDRAITDGEVSRRRRQAAEGQAVFEQARAALAVARGEAAQ